MSLLKLPLDWERKKVEEIRKILDDIPTCRASTFRIQWVEDPSTCDRTKVPVAILEFPQYAREHAVPAMGIRLTTMPRNTLIEGDKLRRAIRESTEQFLLKNGIVIDEDTDAESTIRVPA